MVTAVTGVILGSGSLLLSFWQTQSQVQLHQYSSRPVVIFDQSFTEEQHFVQRIINVGNGPARLKWFSVWANNEALQTWVDLFTLLGVTYDPDHLYTLVPPDHVLPASNPTNVQLLFKTEVPHIARKTWRKHKNIQMQLCYCDMLTGRCWIETLNTTNNIDIAAKSCDAETTYLQNVKGQKD